MKLCLLFVVILALAASITSFRLGRLPNSLARWSSPKDIDNISILKSLEVRGGATKYKRKGIMTFLRSLVEKLKGYLVKNKPKIGKKNTARKGSAEKDVSIARIQKEMQEFIDNPPVNCRLTHVSKGNIRKWDVTLTGCEGTVYAGEEYKLRIEFSKQYPAKAPSVYFLKPSPRHVHVYSNGDICLNILGKEWRPTMTAQTIVVSILSMLSSAKSKGMPVDNASHADLEPGKQAEYLYHDEKC